MKNTISKRKKKQMAESYQEKYYKGKFPRIVACKYPDIKEVT